MIEDYERLLEIIVARFKTQTRWYQDINTSSAKWLYDAAKERGVKTTMAKVKDFFAKQQAAQVTKIFKKPKDFNSIIAPRPGSNSM
eukprot:SAG22_NODE_27_length_29018_cov_465.809646_36_plen_86_part_00